MGVKLKLNGTMRAIHIELERGPRLKRHQEMMFEFQRRGIWTRYHVSGPAPLPAREGGPYKRDLDKIMIIFDIDEQYADEYINRIRARITKAELATHGEKK